MLSGRRSQATRSVLAETKSNCIRPASIANCCPHPGQVGAGPLVCFDSLTTKRMRKLGCLTRSTLIVSNIYRPRKRFGMPVASFSDAGRRGKDGGDQWEPTRKKASFSSGNRPSLIRPPCHSLAPIVSIWTLEITIEKRMEQLNCRG